MAAPLAGAAKARRAPGSGDTGHFFAAFCFRYSSVSCRR